MCTPGDPWCNSGYARQARRLCDRSHGRFDDIDHTSCYCAAYRADGRALRRVGRQWTGSEMDMGMTHPWVVRRLEERADGKRGEEGKREAKRTTYKMATQHPVLFPIWPLSITRDGVVPVLPARESARRGPPRDGAEMAASKRQVAVRPSRQRLGEHAHMP